jgi:hypothetical protein
MYAMCMQKQLSDERGFNSAVTGVSWQAGMHCTLHLLQHHCCTTISQAEASASHGPLQYEPPTAAAPADSAVAATAVTGLTAAAAPAAAPLAAHDQPMLCIVLLIVYCIQVASMP